MTSKSNKYSLLDKNQPEEEQYQMIEMKDMDPSKKYTYRKQRQSQNFAYVSLEDEVNKNMKANQSNQPPAPVYTQKQIRPQNQPSNKPQPQPQPQPQPKKPQPQQGQQPVINYPTYSANPNPTRIQMNGASYKLQNAPQPKKSKVPQMKVACNFCTFEQNVPGNTQVYACCCCSNMNECFPLYGLFICGYCQSKVCYPYGTSDMIRCTRCGTVNKVPLQPQKQYADQPQYNQPQYNQKKVQKKQQKKQQRSEFFVEQEIMQQAEEPTRPKQKVQQQEISFDDIPSLSEVQQKQLNNQNKYY